jgi:predicted nucleic acid-binding protein
MEQTGGRVFVSWHSISNLYYIASRERTDEDVRRYITRLLSFAQIAETNTEHLRYALDLDMRDFEDAMQVAAAYACNAERIVTRNIVDFVNSPIQAITPQQALSELF